MTDPTSRFPQPGDPEWLRRVVTGATATPTPGTDIPPLPGPVEGYRALAALTPDPVVVVDAALRIVALNDPLLELFDGPDRGWLVGQNILRMLVEWERVRAANLVARFLDTGVWDIAELTALHPDGRTFPIEARCEMLRDSEGRFAGMLVLVRDLTSRQEAEDPLRAVVAATSGVVGGEFFGSLVQHLSQILGVRFAGVGEIIEPGRDRVRTLAFWDGDRFIDNFTYPLAGTPCDRVVAGETCYFPEGIRRLFPADEWLVQVGAEGYLGSPLTDSSGRVIGILEVLDTSPIYRSRDVRSIMQIIAARAGAELERLRIESAFRRSEERLAAAVRGSQDGLLDADLLTGETYASPRFYEILGYRGHEGEVDLSLDGLLARVHPLDATETRAKLQRCLEEGSPLHLTCRARTRHAGYRWFEARLDAQTDALGNPTRISGFVTDVTEVRRAELLAEQTGSLAEVGGWDLDLASGSLHWTPSNFRLHGVSTATFTPTVEAALQFYAPDSRPVITAALERAMTTGEAWDLTLQLDTATGSRRWVRVLGRAVQEAGRPVRLLGAIQDITQRRTLEDQLLQSQKMEGIGRLAGGVAHDFNNLLTAIMGYCELALGTLPPEHEVREDLEQIRRAGTSAAALTGQLLAFARRQMIAPRVLDLPHLLEELRPLLARLTGDDIRLQIEAPIDTWPVKVDPGPFEQVLVNLTVNARDAMPDGGTLTITLGNLAAAAAADLGRPGLADHDWVSLAVHDTGTGMPEAVRALAFEPFFTTKPKGKGTGLGLATCHGIVAQAGGQIWADSAPGAGTCIMILLPRSADLPDASPEAVADAGIGGTETLLLIEDEPPVRAVAARALRALGYTVLEASDGPEAIAQLEGHPAPIDLVISDMVLPGMSGTETVQELLARRPALRVLFVSGFAEAGVPRGGGLTPEVAFLSKPYTPARLAAKAREVLDRDGHHRTAPG